MLALTAAWEALTSDDLPMPRAPQSSALFAGRPLAKRSVFSISVSRTRSMPLSSVIWTRLTRGTGTSREPCACQMKASAESKSEFEFGRGASRSSASAIRVKVCASGAPDVGLAADFGFGLGLDLAIGTLSVGRSHTGAAFAPQGAKPGKIRILGPFRRTRRRCNWSADRYIPRTFGRRWGGRRRRDSRRTISPTQRPFMFISPAFAQGGSLFGGGDNMMLQMAPFILIFVIMYFLILRPQ